MIEFKQIIGRGTRTFEDKHFFTIWDFVKAHENFFDPEWDGEPINPSDPPEPADQPEPGEPGDPPIDPPPEDPEEIIVVRLSDGSERSIKYLKQTTYLDENGVPISSVKFLERLFDNLNLIVKDEETLRNIWSNPVTRDHFMEQIKDKGLTLDQIAEIHEIIDAPKSDLFDALAFIAFNVEPMTRQDRVNHVDLSDHSDEMQKFLRGILNSYMAAGEKELTMENLTRFIKVSYGATSTARQKLGEMRYISGAYLDMQKDLYKY